MPQQAPLFMGLNTLQSNLAATVTVPTPYHPFRTRCYHGHSIASIRFGPVPIAVLPQ